MERITRSRIAWAVTCLSLIVTACSSGGLTLQEYATEAEGLIVVVRGQIDTLDSEWVAETPTPEGVQEYWSQRLRARGEFLEGLETLDVPGEAAELHKNIVDLFSRLNVAERALAFRISSLDTVTTHWEGWDSPEGQAAQAVDQELTDLCYVTQAELDSTEAREILADTPWFPSEMKEVVSVALGCSE